MIFRQLFDQDTWTYTYLIGDADTKEAVLIDPVVEQVERDLKLVQELGLTLKYCIETHVHADQISRLSIRRVVPSLAATSVTSGVACRPAANSSALAGCRSFWRRTMT